ECLPRTDRRSGRAADPPRSIAPQLTLNEPFMKLACGSQTNLYVPFFRVTVNVFVPVAPTLVMTLTPGPVRWKLCWPDLSATTSLIFPALVGFFAIVIVKPGPTVPLNVGVAANA